MKSHLAILVLLGSIIFAPLSFAQQRSGAPAQAAAATPAQQEEVLREAQRALERMRTTNMPETDRVNMLRELERSLVQLQRMQEDLTRVQALTPGGVTVTGDGLSSGRFLVRRVARADGATNAWWTNASLVANLGLTEDQKFRIERTFEASRQNLTTSRDQLEKEEAQLAKLLAADSLDRGAITTQINHVIQARGEMERVNSLMTLEMRGVLTSAQWNQLQLQTQNPNAFYVVAPPPAGAAPAPGGLGRGGGAGGLGGGQRSGQRGPAPAPPQQ